MGADGGWITEVPYTVYQTRQSCLRMRAVTSALNGAVDLLL